MSFVKVKRLVLPYDAKNEDYTVIINTDRIYRIKKVLSSPNIAGSYYCVYYDCVDLRMEAPDAFDRENAEIIFKAIGVSLD